VARSGRPVVATVVPACRRAAGVNLPFTATTPYVNTIPTRSSRLSGQPGHGAPYQEPGPLECHGHGSPGQQNAGGYRRPYFDFAPPPLCMKWPSIIFCGPHRGRRRDVVYFQGHAAPGMYAALTRRAHSQREAAELPPELKSGGGLSSYPHPWLMPDFWDSDRLDGAGSDSGDLPCPLIRYLEDRGLKKSASGNVWAFMGDGEMDERSRLAPLLWHLARSSTI